MLGSGCRRCSWKQLVMSYWAVWVFPGLLPSPGSKTLWLSQSCSLIYPLTLCLSLPPPSLSLSDTLLHLSLSLMLSPFPSTHSSNEHILLLNKICLNEQANNIYEVRQHNSTKRLSYFLAFVVYFPTHTLFLLIFPSSNFLFSSLLLWTHWFLFLHVNFPLLSFILIKCKRLHESTMLWINPSLYGNGVCLSVFECVYLCITNWCNTATMWPAVPPDLKLSMQTVPL